MHGRSYSCWFWASPQRWSRTRARWCHGATLLGLCAALLSSLSACSREPGRKTADDTAKAASAMDASEPLRATVTTGMLADLVREIGGTHVSVKQLMGPGVDPHLHKPSVVDVRAIASADIVFYNGLMLEGKMAEVLGRAKNQRSVAAAESLPPEILGLDTTEQHHPDPHVWMSVDLWRQVAQTVRDELAAIDPQHARDYAVAHARLSAQLAELHAYGVEILAGVPEEQRVLVTSHDAFRYFGRAYDIEVQAIQGISTESEAGLNRINELVDMLVVRKIGSVFIESSVPKESIEALLRGAQARGHHVEIAGTLYSDAMGAEGTYEGTYIGMMDHNLSTIARSLGNDTVPAGGFRSRQQQASP